MYTQLRRGGRSYKKNRQYRGSIKGRVSIDSRPEIVANRLRIGDWEVDSVIGKLNKSSLVTLVERISRYTAILKVNSKEPEVVAKAIIQRAKELNMPIHTITGDNGTEFADHTKISEEGPAKSRKMKLMYVVLYIDEFLYDILEFFLQEGIEGATVIESFGMGQYISNIPMFAEFIGFMKENKNQSKTIMALVPEEKESSIIEGIEEITGNLDKKDGALVMTMDISFFKGSMKML